MQKRWAALMELAAESHGLVTLRQTEDCGVTRQTMARHFESHGWVRVAPGVYLAPGYQLSPWVRARAVDLAVTALDPELAPLGAVSHRTAAAFHGLIDRVRLPIDYTTHLNCSKRPPKTRIRRARWLEESSIVEIAGVHALAPEPMFATLSTGCAVDELVQLLRTAHRLRVCTPDQMWAWLPSAPQLPRLQRLVTALHNVGVELTHSDAEQLGRALLRAAGFRPAPSPVTVYDERGPIAEIDIPLMDEKIAIVVDGPHHDDPDQRRFDDDQRLRLQMQDWLIIRVDLHRLRHQPNAFISQVRMATAQRRNAG